MERLVLKHLPKEREKLLMSRGVPQADLMHGTATLDVLGSLVKYETNIPGVHSKLVSAQRQSKALESILGNPLRGNYAVCVNSFPSDLSAKHLATHLFSRAVEAWYKRHKPGRSLPLWHRVFGGLHDVLRDRHTDDVPSLLVISNINESSSAHKLEKVRDILEKYSHVPRIVVSSGSDPITFFTTKLHYPLHAGIHLGPQNRIKEL
jgi:hypothetical protein